MQLTDCGREGPWALGEGTFRTFNKAGIALRGSVWCPKLRQTGKYYMLPMGDTE